MATYTEHYGLHQWEASDDFLRTDFNTDFQKIDAALGEKPDIVFGSYAGDGNYPRAFNLGFQPRAVLLFSNAGHTNAGSSIFGGLFAPGKPLGYPTSPVAQVSETGWTAIANTTNRSGDGYFYLVFK